MFDFGNSVVDNFPNTPAGSNQITVEVTALVTAAANNVDGTTIVNTATLSWGTGQLTATAPVKVVEPKLTISKTASVSHADAGDFVTYTVTVAHAPTSDAPAFDLVLSDPIPAGAVLVPGTVTTTAGSIVTGNGASDTSVKVTDPLLLLANTITITYEVKLTPATLPGGTVTNTAGLGYDHGPSTRPDSGSASSSVTINSSGISGFVYVDANNDGIYQNGTETPLGNVQVTLTGTDYLGNTVNIPVTTNAVTGGYLISGLRPGTYTLTETEPAGYFKGKDTPGTLFGGNAPPPPSTIIQTIVIPAESDATGINYNFGERIAADLAVTKTVDNATPLPGTDITFTVTVTNNGPSNATGVVVSDPLPSGLQFVSSSAGAAYDSTTGLWTIGNLANGAAVSLNVVALVVSTSPATNTATISHEDQFDQDLTNNSASVTETPQAIDLGVTKTIDNATPTVGYTVNYTIGLTNTGLVTATDVALTDLLPSGLSFISDTATQGTYDATTGIWTVGSLPVGGNLTLDIVARVMSPDPQTNTVTVSHADQSDTNPANNTASVTETPNLCDNGLLSVATNFNLFTFQDANLSGTEAAGRVAVGGNATLTNFGVGYGLPNSNGSRDDLIVNNNLTYTNGQVLNGNLVYGNSETLNDVTIPNGTAFQGSDFDFTAVQVNETVESSVLAARPDNGQVQSANGTLSLLGTDPTINVFTVPGDLLANASTVTITAPQGSVVIINVSGTSDQIENLGLTLSGTDNQHVVWNFSQATSLNISGVEVAGSVLAPLANVSFNSGGLDGTLVANSVTGGGEFHNAPSQVGCVAYLQPTQNGSQADLAITKTDGVTLVIPGTNTTYTIVVTNNGPGNVTGALVSDVLPAGTTFVSATGGATYNAATNTVSYTTGTLATSANTSFTVTLAISPTLTGTLTNTATVLPPAGVTDPNPANNSASDTDTLTPPGADLSITKTDGMAWVAPGTNDTYTITVTNNGPNSVTGAKVSDVLPAGTTFVSATGGVTYNAATNTVSYTTGTLAVLGTTSFTVKLALSAGLTGTLTNTATVAAPAGVTDPNLANNSASDSDVVTTHPTIDLGVTKTIDDATPTVGYTVTYTIGLTNTGLEAATHVTLTDLLPAGLSFVSATPSQGTYNKTTGIWTVGTVPLGANLTLDVVARVMSANPRTNTVKVSHADQVDTNPANNTASVTETPILCDNGLLSAATNFDVVTFQNANLTGTESAGRVAIGGNATLTSFGVGAGLTNSNGTRDDLIVNGNLTYKNGQVLNGNIVYGNSATLNNVGIPNGTARKGNVFDFTAVQINEKVESGVLATRPSNGLVQSAIRRAPFARNGPDHQRLLGAGYTARERSLGDDHGPARVGRHHQRGRHERPDREPGHHGDGDGQPACGVELLAGDQSENHRSGGGGQRARPAGQRLVHQRRPGRHPGRQFRQWKRRVPQCPVAGGMRGRPPADEHVPRDGQRQAPRRVGRVLAREDRTGPDQEFQRRREPRRRWPPGWRRTSPTSTGPPPGRITWWGRPTPSWQPCSTPWRARPPRRRTPRFWPRPCRSMPATPAWAGTRRRSRTVSTSRPRGWALPCGMWPTREPRLAWRTIRL